MTRIMKKVKCRELLSLAIRPDQNTVNFGHMFRLFSLLIKGAGVENVVLEIPKLVKETGDTEGNLTDKISKVEADVKTAFTEIETSTGPTARDLIEDSFVSAILDGNEDDFGLPDEQEIRNQYINKGKSRQSTGGRGSTSGRRPSTVIADNFKCNQLARQVGSVEDDLAKVFEILDQLSMKTNESEMKIDDLAVLMAEGGDNALMGSNSAAILAASKQITELETRLHSEMVSWTDLNQITRMECDEESGVYKRCKLSDSDSDRLLEENSRQFTNLMDHHITKMTNMSQDLDKLTTNIKQQINEIDTKISILSETVECQMTSIRGELQIEAVVDCESDDDRCESVESTGSFSRRMSRRKSMSTKQAIGISLDKIAIITAHEEDIFDMKKIQANLVTQIEDLEIGASSLNKMISFLRDNQRGSTSPNGKFGLQLDDNAIENIQESIVDNEAKIDRLSQMLTDLVEGDVMKGESLKKMQSLLGDLSEKSASLDYVEEVLQNKADVEDIAGKVNKQEFDHETTLLSETITDLLERINEQDTKLVERIEKMNQFVSDKVGKEDLAPFQTMIETRIETIRQILDKQSKHIADSKKRKAKEAAGAKKALACISCDGPAKQFPVPYSKQGGDPQQILMSSLPEGGGLPALKSIRPYTSFELDALRTANHKTLPGINYTTAYNFAIEEKNVHRHLVRMEHQNQKQTSRPGIADIYSTARACGGGHTVRQYNKSDKNAKAPKSKAFIEWHEEQMRKAKKIKKNNSKSDLRI